MWQLTVHDSAQYILPLKASKQIDDSTASCVSMIRRGTLGISLSSTIFRILAAPLMI